MSALVGSAALLAWFEIDPAVRTEHDRWYLHEHMPERLSVPGFQRARRYGEGRRVFVIYETADLAVLSSPEYLSRLDAPTAATRRLAHTAEGAIRIAAAPDFSVGNGWGGWVTTTHLHDVPDSDRLALPVQRALEEDPGLVAVHLFRAAEDATASKERTVEAGVAPESGRIPWALVVEGAADVRAATSRLLALLPNGCVAGPTVQLRYQFGMTAAGVAPEN